MKISIQILSCCFLLQWLPTWLVGSSVTFEFFAHPITIPYSPDILEPRCRKAEEKNIQGYYQQLEKTSFQSLLQALQTQRAALQLNDWFYYQLIRHSTAQICRSLTPLEQELVNWFLLSQSGFDTRLTYLEQQVFVYVRSDSEVFEMPMIEDKGKIYINLSPIKSAQRGQPLYMLHFTPQPTGRAFSFYFEQLPTFPPILATRKVSFRYAHTLYEWEVTYDKRLVELLRDYPLIAEEEYIRAPMSPALSASLLPLLRAALEGRTTRESLELLAAFTRAAFAYKEDTEYFGRSKPMIPEELFFYDYSDCEDRVALFFALVRKLLNLPMVVIAFPDHLTLAVATEEPLSKAPLLYQGRAYYVCDPTGPVNSSAIGIMPKEYENEPYKILFSHK